MFNIINPKEIKDNLIKAISEEYMLISAGNENGYNMMTASWGFTGEIWGRGQRGRPLCVPSGTQWNL